MAQAPSLRSLGRSGLQVSPLCFGGNVFGWTVDEATSFSLLDAWLDAGMNFIDTADVYSRWAPGHAGGESESVIGKWLRRSGRRADIVLATKVGKDIDRKSTRLNSSHQIISYAVFCLKKKKLQPTALHPTTSSPNDANQNVSAPFPYSWPQSPTVVGSGVAPRTLRPPRPCRTPQHVLF